MITTNYQTYGTSGFNLRLRVYQDGETRYVNVNKLLQGQLTKLACRLREFCAHKRIKDSSVKCMDTPRRGISSSAKATPWVFWQDTMRPARAKALTWMLLPLQGALLFIIIPRVLPWAMSLQGFIFPLCADDFQFSLLCLI